MIDFSGFCGMGTLLGGWMHLLQIGSLVYF